MQRGASQAAYAHTYTPRHTNKPQTHSLENTYAHTQGSLSSLSVPCVIYIRAPLGTPPVETIIMQAGTSADINK